MKWQHYLLAGILILLTIMCLVYVHDRCYAEAIYLEDVVCPVEKFEIPVEDRVEIVSIVVPAQIDVPLEQDVTLEKEIESLKRLIDVQEEFIYVEPEYPVADYVWYYLKAVGYNDYVCAGIMGNLMAETGGQTLNLDWKAWSDGSYYGIAQWSKKFFPDVIGKDLEGQVLFLLSNIEQEFNTFGYAYKKGFNFEKFFNMDNAEEAALAFAKCYERCNSAYYSVRQKNAVKAYDYFVGN